MHYSGSRQAEPLARGGISADAPTVRQQYLLPVLLPECSALFTGSPFMLFMQLARSTLELGVSLRPRLTGRAVGTDQRVAGLAPRPFALGEEPGRCLCCLCN